MTGALCLAACFPVTRPIVKIGLVAPFEGRYRDVGYEVIYAVRLAVREVNARGGLAGHTVELVALDDGGELEMAAEQARKLSTDPLVAGVIGHWLDETTTASAAVYVAAGLPFVATTSAPLPEAVFRLWPGPEAIQAALGPDVHLCPSPCGWIEGADWLAAERTANPDRPVAGPALWAFPQFATLAGAQADGALVIAPAPLPTDTSDTGFADRYRTISNGVEPRTYAVLAYDAANVLFAAIEESVSTDGSLSGDEVAAALFNVSHDGLSGNLSFDGTHQLANARPRLYQWLGGALTGPLQTVP